MLFLCYLRRMGICPPCPKKSHTISVFVISASSLKYQCAYLNKSHINTPVLSSNFLTKFKLFYSSSTESKLKL